MSFFRNNERVVESLYRERDVLHAEIKRLTTLNADQDRQIRDLLKAHPMNEQQLEEIAEVRRTNERMRKQQNLLTVYLRTRFHEDFQVGIHNQRELADICIFYLSRMEVKQEDAQKTV